MRATSAAFRADPDVYMPRFGGYDPVGIARGVSTAGFAGLWAVFEQRLYLFYTAEARRTFMANPSPVIAAAAARWAEVKSERCPGVNLPLAPRCRGITPRDESRYPKTCPSIGEIRAVRRRHTPPAATTHRVSRRHVPFGGRSEPRIEVGGAFGDAAEFQRRAAGEFRYRRKALQERGTCASKCERLTAATRSLGHWRVRIVARPDGAPSATLTRSARPAPPRQMRPNAGAPTTPTTGMPSRTSAIFTVYSSRPARNSRVPSSGSTRKNVAPGNRGRSASSETTGTPGKPSARPRKITACAASSASVTGNSSALWRVLTLRQSNRQDRRPGPKRDCGEKFGGPAVAREVRV